VLADQVVIAAIFRPEAVPESERLDPARLIARLKQQGCAARELPDADAIVAAVAPELRPGDVVAILSTGGFGGIYEKLPAHLQSLSR
jgi:UDP-N-acetylmuramate: L-alanyl-gamma-D-glutamyl-meso-diaminopimelate ligase